MKGTVIQAQESALTSFSKNVDPGKLIGMFLVFVGINAAGTTSALADLGTIIIKRKGRTLVNRKVKTISKMTDIKYGKNLFSSTEAGAFSATLFIPFYELGLEQSLDITGENELIFQYNHNDSTVSNWSTLQCTVNSVTGYSSLPERYEYSILGDDQSPGGAVDKPYPLNDANITSVFLEDEDDIISKAALRNNKGQMYSSQSWESLLGQTLIWNSLETDTFDMVEMQLFSEGEAGSYLNKANTIEIETSGGGLLEITKTFIRPNERYRDLLTV